MKTILAPTHVAKEVASQLLSIGAIRLSPQQPFTWSSGWKSPIYCDNRLALSYPAIRTYIKQELANIITSNIPQFDLIAGVATAGIAQGALVADALHTSFAYVRPKPKEHGMANQIEGRIEAGQKVVVIEDLVSTGGSSLKAVEAIRAAGAEVVGMAAIFTYGFPVADQNFKAHGVQLYCLSDYSSLLQQAQDNQVIAQEQMQVLEQWRTAPELWTGH
ncbi:orotate phosphoribosyltransferase [Cytophagales bacterium LB-30]|uniref:Orotate phosphoribosyltransferase n=1 Tax=Shiella aurantiaca TaxID=3058365 RepID=A0ABT8F4D6_9BACT|nr:orotate phosphoribosyltransferase [Shiella aurantiaca]MDN4165302.1 orotate phosphoribosyltransferase [Shiella aurantiaca]